jgi:hypothetical protein
MVGWHYLSASGRPDVLVVARATDELVHRLRGVQQLRGGFAAGERRACDRGGRLGRAPTPDPSRCARARPCRLGTAMATIGISRRVPVGGIGFRMEIYGLGGARVTTGHLVSARRDAAAEGRTGRPRVERAACRLRCAGTLATPGSSMILSLHCYTLAQRGSMGRPPPQVHSVPEKEDADGYCRRTAISP